MHQCMATGNGIDRSGREREKKKVYSSSWDEYVVGLATSVYEILDHSLFVSLSLSS
jgi:hypothetical protein